RNAAARASLRAHGQAGLQRHDPVGAAMKRAVFVVVAVAACAHFVAKKVAVEAPPQDRLRIPHDRHTSAKVECITCHEGIWDDKDFTGKDLLPEEAKCMECHKEEKDKGNCNFCHSDVAHAANRSKPEPQVRMSHQKHVELTKEDCKLCHTQLPNPYGDAAS